MSDQSEKTNLEKIKDIATIFAAIIIPVVIAVNGNRTNVAIKEKENQTKFAELAVNILMGEPQKDKDGKQTEENQKIRSWAVDILEKYSQVKFPEKAREGLETQPLPTRDNLTQSSIDYSQLERLLLDKKYREADDETRRIMSRLSGSSSNDGYIGIASMQKISCDDIKLIDNIWRTNTDNKFGFSLQREIYTKLGSTEKFGDTVGWRKNGQWLTVNDLDYSDSAPRGHLPTRSPAINKMSGGWLVWNLLPNNSRSLCFD